MLLGQVQNLNTALAPGFPWHQTVTSNKESSQDHPSASFWSLRIGVSKVWNVTTLLSPCGVWMISQGRCLWLALPGERLREIHLSGQGEVDGARWGPAC